MNTEKKSPCCLAKVEKLIEHKLTAYTKDDTEWLLTLEEAKLDKMMPKEVEEPVINKETEKPVVEKKVEEPKVATFEELLATASPETKEQFETGMRTFKAQKETLVDSIITNAAEGTWTKEELMVMSMDTLEKIGKSFPETVNYSPMSTKDTVATNKVKPLMPPGLVKQENK